VSPARGAASRRRPGGPDEEPIVLSQRQLQVVDTLGGAGVLSVSEIADAIGVSRSLATTTVKELVRLGLVDRRMDPEDRRRHQVRLTAAWRSRPHRQGRLR